jgi:hypothetical protein
MHHYFDINVATKYGVYIAIFINNMAFWIQKNIANNKHFYDGRYWTYNSIKSYTILFPYLTSKQIRKAVDDCVRKKLIIKGNYNKKSYDKTSWYAFTELGLETVNLLICPPGQMELPSRANGVALEGKAIPNKNTDKKTNREGEKRAKRFALSDFDKKDFIFTDSQLNDINLIGSNPKTVFNKFKVNLKNKNRKTFTQNEIEMWVVREVEYLMRDKNKIKNEVKCTVPDFISEKDKKKYSSKEKTKTETRRILDVLNGRASKTTSES